jgi:bifunctional DNase/RNase
MTEVTLARLGLDSTSRTYVLILRERDGRRILPIWIGQPEAESIVLHLNGVVRERPLTHDLCRALLAALGGDLERVEITRVVKSTYYAELHIGTDTGHVVVDARPSDSIAIALRVGAPIYAADVLLTAMDEEDEERLGDSADGPLTAPRREAPDEHMTAEQLKAHLEQLRPEDFGKFRP